MDDFVPYEENLDEEPVQDPEPDELEEEKDT